MDKLRLWGWITLGAGVVLFLGGGGIGGVEGGGVSAFGLLCLIAAIVLWVIVAMRAAKSGSVMRSSRNAADQRSAMLYGEPYGAPSVSSVPPVPSAAPALVVPSVPSAPASPPQPVVAAPPQPVVATPSVPPATAPTPKRDAKPALKPYRLLGGKYPSTEVEGEFARTDAIVKAVGRRPTRDEEIILEDVSAYLIPEPTNRYDANAVMVVLNNQHVGYLSRDDAAIYQPILTSIVDAGFAPEVKARIWIVAREQWEDRRKLKIHANVRVALDAPHLIVPLNEPPAAPHSILPAGRALQLTGEENHLDVLTDYVNHEGDGYALGTLTIAPAARAGAKASVEASIDGHVIGKLTAASSEHFIPTIRHLAMQGMAAAAWLRVKGSQISVQVTVQAAKAHEIPETWFEAPQTIPSLHGEATQSEPMWND
ncbi:hypothetical protein PU630_07550 [Microbacterium horticulturae]|uniref:HIRAN domain-containing protein n=1 Tax=Microbacterium horticulturae TaxID=3028316 RepID=A0ABY8C6D6_9MICO|nr:HIRAN domain-containing protein [Microbacterium sp. KACC 23027]WEG10393.1 hypothetical protein PU630_07550 [Microbacterium sp. KACC 23027]